MKCRRRVFIFLLTTSLFLLLSCAERRSSSSRSPGATVPDYEGAFLQNRIAHQQAAIDMARTCLQKAVREELKQFCSKIVNTESDESKQLQGWLREWYNISAQLTAGERATQGYKNFLRSVQTSTGADFEEVFLRALRLHHHEGVNESRDCQARASHPELKSSCSQMVNEQEQELKQMNTWICGWFRDCAEK